MTPNHRTESHHKTRGNRAITFPFLKETEKAILMPGFPQIAGLWI